jgi:hypothetical protein
VQPLATDLYQVENLALVVRPLVHPGRDLLVEALEVVGPLVAVLQLQVAFVAQVMVHMVIPLV